MKLTTNEVNFILSEWCSYGGEYAGLGKRLEKDKPKNLRLSDWEKDLFASKLTHDNCYLCDEELSIQKKLFKKDGITYK